MTTLWRTLALLACLGGFSVVAEDYMMLYDDLNESLDEHSVKVTDPIARLADVHFNNKASRVQVFGESSFELYSNDEFSGYRMVVTPGPATRAASNNYYSSARRICTYDGKPESAKIVIYKDSYRQGEFKEFYDAVPNLSAVKLESNPRYTWDNQLSSSWAVKGDWELYDGENFTGERWVILEGEAKTQGWGFIWSHHNRVTSMRPICATYKPEVTCTPYQVELIEPEDLRPVLDGIEIIGSQSGGTCSGAGEHSMTLSNTDIVTETVSLETTSSEEWSWEKSKSIGVALIAAPWGVGAAIGLSCTTTQGGAVSLSSTEGKSFTEGKETTSAQSITYKAPGAGLIFGVVERYVYDRSNTPTKIYARCSDGSEKIGNGTMNLRSVTFPSVNFWSWSGQYSQTACNKDRSLPECVNDIRRSYTQQTNIDIEKVDVNDDWYACFKGVAGKGNGKGNGKGKDKDKGKGKDKDKGKGKDKGNKKDKKNKKGI